MNPLLGRFGYLRLFALLITALPFLALPLFGLVWLWQTQHLLLWLVVLFACGASGFLVHWIDRRRLPTALASTTGASPDWPRGSAGAWERVEALAQQVDVDQWALDDTSHLLELGRLALDEVARHYHPERSRPLLELTIPHALLIIERASRDLRMAISEQVPFSHQLTLGSVMRVRHWSKRVTRLESVYRTSRALVDPLGSVFREASRAVGHRIVGYGSLRLRRWLLQEYVRKVGYYGIELYSGHLLLDELEGSDLARQPATDDEPLKILVLGRTNAGKSSLINGLFGQMTAATSPTADTTSTLTAYRLEHDEQLRALVFDSPGIESLSDKALRKAVLEADLILWATAASRPDRQVEQSALQRINAWLEGESSRRRPAPVVVAITRIDQLPPLREWEPPYDLNQPSSPKARNIAAAVEAVAADLDMAIDQLVPVCLAQNHAYNLDDGLWTAVLDRYDEAQRARFLRLLPARRRAQAKSMTWRQLRNAGRLMVGKASKRTR